MNSTSSPGAVVCLHQAGGSPDLYADWVTEAPPGMRVLPVGLPTLVDGHVRRRLHRSVTDLVPALVDEMWDDLVDRKFTLFGHSMGALLAYLIARRLLEAEGPRPAALVVACYGAPQEVVAPIDPKADTPTLVRQLHEVGGIPDWLAAEPDLLAPFLGLTRDDAEVCASYRHAPQDGPLDVPVYAVGATGDRLVSPALIHAWSSVARDVETVMLPGGHYQVGAGRTALRDLVFDVAAKECM